MGMGSGDTAGMSRSWGSRDSFGAMRYRNLRKLTLVAPALEVHLHFGMLCLDSGSSGHPLSSLKVGATHDLGVGC